MATGWIGFKVHFVSYPFWSTLYELSAMLLTKPYQWRSALTKSVARKLVKGAYFFHFFIICRLLDKECAILHETPFPDFINSFLCAWKSDACFPAAKSSKKKKGNKGKSDPVVQTLTEHAATYSPVEEEEISLDERKCTTPWASCQVRKIAGFACAENAGDVFRGFPRHRLQRKPLVSDPSIHHGTCVVHVPWCVSGSLTRGGGENVPDIPGAYATRNFTYLALRHCASAGLTPPEQHFIIDTLRLRQK